METLFTAFLSSGMDPNQSFKIPNQRWLDDGNIENSFTEQIKEPESMDSCTDSCNHYLNHIEDCSSKVDVTAAIMFEVKHVTALLCEPQLPFTAYFSHQMYHLSVQRRVVSPFQVLSKCCFQLGLVLKSNHSRMAVHSCCDIDTYKKLSSSQKVCPCEKEETNDRFCKLHHLYIQDMEVNKGSCSWIVSFIENPASELLSLDVCFSNQCYNNNNLELSDSIEIDFTTDEDTVEFEVDKGSAFLQNFIFCDQSNYLVEDEDDTESLVYETSDDEDDDICFQFADVEIGFTSNVFEPTSYVSVDADCYDNPHNDYVISCSCRECTTKDTDNFQKRELTKYHKNCIHKNSSCNTQSMKEYEIKPKKKVHFADPGDLVTVHRLVVWSHAYKQSRKGIWTKLANDRAHFQRRIENIGKVLQPVLNQKLHVLHNSRTN